MSDGNPDMVVEALEASTAPDSDLRQLVEILNYYRANSISTLTTNPTDVAEQRKWLQQFATTGPFRFLVARRATQVMGFAYSSRYRDHEAFRETVVLSIACDVNSRGQGIGSLLYQALFAQLADEPVHVALASIVLPNKASVALHRKYGFTEVGVFEEYAVKHQQYLSSLWMQRLMRPHR